MEETKKRRNKAMRTAGAVFCATMLSTCMMSGTFAKYITSDWSTDQARVAKFGVVVSMGGNLYGQTYNGIDYVSYSENQDYVSINRTDQASNINIVAPGTDGGMNITVKGVPEVSTKLHIDKAESSATATLGKNYTDTTVQLLSNDGYGVMVKDANALKTKENAPNYYAIDKGDTGNNTFVKLTEALFSDDSYYQTCDWYKLNNQVEVSSTYEPIKWTVHDVNSTEVSGYTDVTMDKLDQGVATALAVQQTSTTSGSDTAKQTSWGSITQQTDKSWTATALPNKDLAGAAKISWKWDYSTATTDGTATGDQNASWIDLSGTDGTQDASSSWPKISGLAGYENTSTEDLEDTILGDMIAKASTTDTTVTADMTPDYFVVYDDSGTYKKVQYAKVNAATDGNAANEVYIAYKSGLSAAPTKMIDASGGLLATLEVSYNPRVTIEQITDPNNTNKNNENVNLNNSAYR